MDAICLLILG